MIREKETLLIRLMKVADAVVILGSVCLAYFITAFIRDRVGLIFWDSFGSFFQAYLWLGILAVLIWVSAMSYYRVYDNFRIKPLSETMWYVLLTGGLTVIFLGSATFIIKMQVASRMYIIVFIVTGVTLLGIEKTIFSKIIHVILRSGYNLINILIVGTGVRAQHLIEVVKAHADWGFRIVGLIDDDPKLLGKKIMGYPVIGRIRDIPRIIHSTIVDRVMFVVPRMWLNRIEDAIRHCEIEGISTAVCVDLYRPKLAKMHLSDFAGIPLIMFQTSLAKEWQLFIKRTADLLVSLIMILLLLPLFLVAVIGVKISSKGPIFFRQKRCGLNGREFTLYKFRSMYVGAEMRKKELERQNEMQGPVFKMKRDPRVTRFGRFMRRFSIDELPQLINVLKGDMSLVGPRPPLPEEVKMYETWHRRRLSMKPGVTCIWQVSGRNKVDFQQWMDMDLEYIDNFSLWLDFIILFRTVFVVLTGYGAA
jgi:exopolysaccharide biosynthesis polyprenyl glycosylphosphotransferase